MVRRVGCGRRGRRARHGGRWLRPDGGTLCMMEAGIRSEDDLK